MSVTASVTASVSFPAPDAGWNANRHFATPCNGPTNFSTTTNDSYCTTVQCSPMASTSPPSLLCANASMSTPCSIWWIRWYESHSSRASPSNPICQLPGGERAFVGRAVRPVPGDLRCAGDPDRVCPDSWVVRADVESRGRWTRPGSHGRHRRSPGRRPRFRQSQLDRLGALRVWNGVLRSDPTRALGVLREGLVYAKEHRMPVWESNIAFLAAGLGSGTRQSPARFGDV